MTEPTPHGGGSEIAIIGLAGRFPQAPDLKAFWRNLREGRESISFFSRGELLAAGVAAGLADDPRYVPARGILDDAEGFDATLFGFSPREAALTDPQQRLFLECAWEALERAGHDPLRFPGPIGVFAGSSTSRYALSRLTTGAGEEALQVQIGNDKDFLATRTAYKLDLKGPSLSVGTACSTSLVAVHLACQSLLAGECDLALAGGASVATPQKEGYLYHEGGILSPDGHCRPFDAEAAGTVRGNGVGIVVLRRLADALAGGDRVHAVIKGTAVNNDGATKMGYTAMAPAAVAAVITEAQAVAGVGPETVSFVEAHGTGTRLGDPAELAALTQVFRGDGRPRGFCALGAVKGLIGHLDATAGIAGLIKVVLALEHGEIPPHPTFRGPNPEVDLAAGPFYIPTEVTPWPRGPTPRRAGVSSLGIGGTNAHVVLEEAPERAPEEAPAPESSAAGGPATGTARPYPLLLWSAATRSALDAQTRHLGDFLRRHPEVELADVAFTLQFGRRQLAHRRMLVGRGHRHVADALERGGDEGTAVRSAIVPGRRRPVVFLFPGSGAQHPGMGRELYRGEPVFRRWMDRAAEILEPHLGLDLRHALYGDVGEPARGPDGPPASEGPSLDRPSLDRPSLAQTALFATEVALARLWMSWGIRPDAVLGHSLGEVAAAHLAGVLSFEEALTLVARRAHLMESLPAGAMLAVALPPGEVRKHLGGELSLAAVNGPESCTVAGPREAVEALATRLAGEGVETRRLATGAAFHSPQVEPILEELGQAVAGLSPGAPEVPCLSGVTGDWMTEADATDPTYWLRHLRQPVRFSDASATLLAEGEPIALEVGPGRTLGSLLGRQPTAPAGMPRISSLPHPGDDEPEEETVTTALGRLWLAGVEVDWEAYHAGGRRRRVELPPYPFEHRRYWMEPAAPSEPGAAGLARRADPADWFYVPSWRRAPLPPVAAPEVDAGPWLVLGGGGPFHHALVNRLARAGAEVVEARFAGAFSARGDGGFGVRSGEADDFRRLFAHLAGAGATPRHLVHLGCLDGEGPPGLETDPFAAAQEAGLYTLLALAQGWEAAGGGPTHLTVVTAGVQEVVGDEEIHPERATVLAACRILPQEHRQLACRAVDLPPEAGAEGGEVWMEALLAELAAGAGEAVVAQRGRHRWVEEAAAVRMEAVEGAPGGLHRRGAVLITGGLGRVGTALAEELAETAAARLVLVGRTALPPRGEWDRCLAEGAAGDPVGRRVEAVRRLEALGAEVMVAAADVADEVAMARVLAAAEERFGPLCGVIHAAGVVAAEAFQPASATGRELCRRHFRPKVEGLRVLHRLLAGRRLDFWHLTSSLSAVLGGVGFCAYAAANLYLDAFARARRRAGDTAWISAAWEGWRFDAAASGTGGEAEADPGRSLPAEGPPGESPPAEAPPHRRFGAQLRQLALSPREGREVFHRLLGADAGAQVFISTGDLAQRRRQWLELPPEAEAEVDGGGTVQGRPPGLETAFVAPRDELEAAIAGLWGELLGLTGIGVHDNFFELGGHSLLATQVLSRLRRRHGVEVSLHHFFAATTVARLAAVVAEAQGAPTSVGGAPSREAPHREAFEEGVL